MSLMRSKRVRGSEEKFVNLIFLSKNWRGGRAVECARLESVYTLIAYRGFESPSLRQLIKKGHPTDGLF